MTQDFNLNALAITGPWLLDLKARGELHGVFIDGKRRGWYCICVDSLEVARKQYDFHVKNKPDRMAKLISQKGVIEETSKFEEEDL